MIKKLDRTLRHERDSGFIISEPVSIGEMQEKINELVDAVNELTSYVGPLGVEFIEPKQVEFTEPNLADPYAEQRKWIGKLCWFWDDEKEEKVCGILTTIDSDCGLSDMCPYWNGTTSNWFEHCEPVKPDDNIIYKGDNNE